MNIQNNILRHALKNVYFLCGNACGGKTTLSRMLAEKHGFALYDMDATYDVHRAIADEEHQSATCYHMKDHHEQWTRPIEVQARHGLKSNEEQTEMVLVDLIRLSEKQKVVADVLFSPAYSPDLLDPKQIVFLTVPRTEIRGLYFNRPEKRGFYEFVKRQPLADLYFENIFLQLERINELEQELMRKTGFLMLERRADESPEERLSRIERHFGLIK